MLTGARQAFGSPLLPPPGPTHELSVASLPFTPAPAAAACLPASTAAPAAANGSTAPVAAASALLAGRSGPAWFLLSSAC